MKFTLLGLLSMNLGLWFHIWASRRAEAFIEENNESEGRRFPIWLLPFLLAGLFLLAYFRERMDLSFRPDISILMENVLWFILFTSLGSFSVFYHFRKTKNVTARRYFIAGPVVFLLGFSITIVTGYRDQIADFEEKEARRAEYIKVYQAK